MKWPDALLKRTLIVYLSVNSVPKSTAQLPSRFLGVPMSGASGLTEVDERAALAPDGCRPSGGMGTMQDTGEEEGTCHPSWAV